MRYICFHTNTSINTHIYKLESLQKGKENYGDVVVCIALEAVINVTQHITAAGHGK